jgi:hypothetical protein
MNFTWPGGSSSVFSRALKAPLKHVHLVDQVPFGGPPSAAAGALDDLADVVDAGVGGGVHLSTSGAALHDLRAMAPVGGHVEGRLVDVALA